MSAYTIEFNIELFERKYSLFDKYEFFKSFIFPWFYGIIYIWKKKTVWCIHQLNLGSEF